MSAEMKEMAAEAEKLIESMLAGMPPEQRERLEAIRARIGGLTADPEELSRKSDDFRKYAMSELKDKVSSMLGIWEGEAPKAVLFLTLSSALAQLGGQVMTLALHGEDLSAGARKSAYEGLIEQLVSLINHEEDDEQDNPLELAVEVTFKCK